MITSSRKKRGGAQNRDGETECHTCRHFALTALLTDRAWKVTKWFISIYKSQFESTQYRYVAIIFEFGAKAILLSLHTTSGGSICVHQHMHLPRMIMMSLRSFHQLAARTATGSQLSRVSCDRRIHLFDSISVSLSNFPFRVCHPPSRRSAFLRPHCLANRASRPSASAAMVLTAAAPGMADNYRTQRPSRLL